MTLAANPSHLEAVDPVVEGLARAEQTDRSHGAGDPRPDGRACRFSSTAMRRSRGRASSRRPSTSTPSTATRRAGTLHVIANNQIGFTTDPAEGRSTRYSSDLAKGFDVPIVHVNADDPEAALSAIRLALAYRDEFGHDVVIDLVGYRRFGHNEQDEAAYTQPLQSRAHRAAGARTRVVRGASRCGGCSQRGRGRTAPRADASGAPRRPRRASRLRIAGPEPPRSLEPAPTQAPQ